MNLAPLTPEIFVLVMACVTLVVDLFLKNKTVTYLLVQGTLVFAAVFTVLHFTNTPQTILHDTFIADGIGGVLKLFIYLTSFGAFWFSKKYIAERDIPFGEYYILGLFSVLGMMILVSASHFLTLYLGLELLSLPLYAMVALQRDSVKASEAAMKYFVMGAIASGMLLYGLSILYGLTGSLTISEVATALATLPDEQTSVMVVALVFSIAGLVFKFGAAPFHMWVPDVYEAAPTPAALFISSAPKIATLGMAIRLLVDTLPGLNIQWQEILIVVALLSMGLGNIVAIAQTNIKRMLAYSSIAHVGYMSLGLLSANQTGYGAAMFYIIVYAIMSMGAFAMIILISRNDFEAEMIDDYRGLNSRNPWLAFMMLLLMFSMAGVPPTVGFFAKLTVLESLVQIHMEWLAVVALLFAVVGVYYYLRIVKVMYFDAPEDTTPIITPRDTQLAISINGLAILALGIFPGALIRLCQMVF